MHPEDVSPRNIKEQEYFRSKDLAQQATDADSNKLQAVHIEIVENGYIIRFHDHYRGKTFVATGLDMVHGIIQQELVAEQIRKSTNK